MSDVQTRIGIAPVVVGGSAARGELALLWREFRDGKMSVEEFNAEMRNTSGAIYAQRRAVMLMRTEYRNQRAALYEAMRGFRAVARIGRTITSTYQTYTLMQTRVADRTRDVKDTQEDLIKIQERRIRVVSDLGATNAIALRLINEEERLTKRLTDERRGLKQAQDQNIVGYVGIGLQALAVIPNVVSLMRHIDLTRLYLGETWSYTGLTGLVTAAGAAKVSILGAKVALSSLANLAMIPIVAYLTIEIRKKLMETEYWGDRDPDLPPGPANVPGFRLDEWLSDIWDQAFGDGMQGEGLIPEDLVGELLGELGGLGEWEGKDYGDSTLPGGDGASVTVEGDDVEVQVDVTVTKTRTQGGGSRLR